MKTQTLLLSGLLFLQSQSFAQSSRSSSGYNQKETVILNRDQDGSTTIEINGSGVYVNGEQIATRPELGNRNLRKKIIIRDDGSGGSANRNYEEYYNSGRGNRGSEHRAMLGVFTDVRKSGDGAYIERVTPGSAAAEAGLKPGDVIIRVDSTNVYNAEDLTRTIRAYEPNDRVTIAYDRNGRERQTTAVLGQASAQTWPQVFDDPGSIPTPPMPPMSPSDDMTTDKPRLGVTVEDTENGVRIGSVREGSIADNAGLRTGDVITYIDSRKVNDVTDVQKAVGTARSGSKMKIELNRQGSRVTKTVSFPREGRSKDL